MGSLFKRIMAVPKMLKDPSVKFSHKLLIVAGVVYLFSPIDIVPDPILGFGLIDDAAVSVYIISTIKDELDKYILDNKKVKVKKEKIIDNVDYKIEDE